MAGMFGPITLMTNELGEEQRQQVNTLLAELQAKYNSNTTVFGEAEVIATAKTFRQIQDIYHSNARIDGHEGLLVDTGAVQNLTGDGWTDRMDQRLPAGKESEYKDLETPQSVMGVGKEPDVATKSVWMPIGVTTADGTLGAGYSATVLPQSAVPAPLGLNSMQDSNTILDLRDNKLHMWIASDRDDLEVRVKPGREKKVSRLQMQKAPSGHLLLNCTDYPQSQAAWATTFTSTRPRTMLEVPAGIDQYN